MFHKDGLEPIARKLDALGVTLYSTGGTQKFLEELGIPVIAVEDVTSYPSILGGRVKTLHPKVFGGILGRRDHANDQEQLKQYDIPAIDLVVVDLYPFEDTVSGGGSHEEIIEKIDIGGIALIRAAAKNFQDVLIVPSRNHYPALLELLESGNGHTDLESRRSFARDAFAQSSHYDSQIFGYFDREDHSAFRASVAPGRVLRYGENPHQRGVYYGDFAGMFDQLHGKQLSYNNLLDVDAAVQLMHEFTRENPTFAVLKHNNACGLATRPTLSEAYAAALAGDPVSAFGGILIANRPIDASTAQQIHDLFCEVVIAPDFDADALAVLQGKKNRILLRQKTSALPNQTFRTILNGVLVQDRDDLTESSAAFEKRTDAGADDAMLQDLVFANKLVKHTKSNTIVFAKDLQLFASGTGQTSRVDACRQAIEKAKHFGFDLTGAVMASDAFFPFPDCVELAADVGVKAVVQPGGSIKDQLSIDACNARGMAMYFTGNRHFRH